MSRFITQRSGDGTSSSSAGLSANDVKNTTKTTCIIHCYPWTLDYGSVLCFELPWNCYDGFDIE